MDTEELEQINKRAISLAPKDSVLFLFNIESGYNFNNPDIEVRPVEALNASGRTQVLMKGLANRGLSGNPSAIGTARFIYIRPNLGTMGIPNDGSFFDIFSGEPTFIGSVEEFKRRTSFNCTKDDFDEAAFYPDIQGVRRLKAAVTSHRFIGEVILGKPKRDRIDLVLTQNIVAGFEGYDGIFFLNADRMGLHFDYSHRPDVIQSLQVGQSIIIFTHPLVTFLLDHLRRKDIQAGFTPAVFQGVNLYGMTVTHRGAVRPIDGSPINGRDRVVTLRIRSQNGEWQGGEIRLFYSSTRSSTPMYTPATITAFNLNNPRVWTGDTALMLNALQVGDFLHEASNVQLVTNIFQTQFGVMYDPGIHGQMKAVFKGNNRPEDQLPVDVLTSQIIEFEIGDVQTGAYSGPLKLLYRV